MFMTGRSQAVRLPKAYRLQVDEVLIERQPDGALLLRPKPKSGLGERLRTVLRRLPADAGFVRPEQPPLERDARWWAEHGPQAPAPRRRRPRR